MLGQDFQEDMDRKARIQKLAEDITYTCWQMYEQQPTGIAPERVKSMKMDLSRTDTREYILRPEALEGMWYMWEKTRNPKYREWSWKIFQNFQKYLKVRLLMPGYETTYQNWHNDLVSNSWTYYDVLVS